MEVELYRGKYNPQLERVTKRLRDKICNPIDRRHDNTILDSRPYEVEFSDGEKIPFQKKR